MKNKRITVALCVIIVTSSLCGLINALLALHFSEAHDSLLDIMESLSEGYAFWEYIPILFAIFFFIILGLSMGRLKKVLWVTGFLGITLASIVIPTVISWSANGFLNSGWEFYFPWVLFLILIFVYCVGAALAAFLLHLIYKKWVKHTNPSQHFSTKEKIILSLCVLLEIAIWFITMFLWDGLKVYILAFTMGLFYIFPMIFVLLANGIIWFVLSKKPRQIFVFGNLVSLLFTWGISWLPYQIFCDCSWGSHRITYCLIENLIYDRSKIIATLKMHMGDLLGDDLILYTLPQFGSLLALFAIYIAIASLITFICKTIKKKKAAKQPALDIDSYFADYYD